MLSICNDCVETFRVGNNQCLFCGDSSDEQEDDNVAWDYPDYKASAGNVDFSTITNSPTTNSPTTVINREIDDELIPTIQTPTFHSIPTSISTSTSTSCDTHPWMQEETNEQNILYDIPGRIEHLGLSNLGNSCYINAALQILLHSEDMVQLMIQRLNDNQPLTIENIHDLRLQYTRSMQTAIYEQCDASFLFNYVCDKINDTYECKYNPICSLQMRSRTVCSNEECKHIVESQQYENMLIAYPQKGYDCLLECISDSLREFVDKKCEKCQEKTQAQRQTRIGNTPKCLFIRLQPFQENQEEIQMDLPMCLTLNNNLDYELKGFIEHKGSSIHYGHYVAYCLDGNGWNCYNDDRITHIASDELESKLFIQSKTRSFISFLWYEQVQSLEA